jgi:hypothetical protein
VNARVKTPYLKHGITYIITHDYWPKGGERVRLVSFVPAKTLLPGTRGNAAVVKSYDGQRFWIHPKSYLFEDVTETNFGMIR